MAVQSMVVDKEVGPLVQEAPPVENMEGME